MLPVRSTPLFVQSFLRSGALRALIAVAALAGVLAAPASAPAVGLPPGFEESSAFSGLTQPISMQFASDGRVFVAEKSGIVKVFDGMGDTTPTVFADLRTQVHNYWDRGLMSIALHPDFPATPYVYVYYVADAPIGGTAPTWGVAGATSDTCPNPPGGTGDGCVVSGRLSRLTASGNTMSGSEQVLVNDWCQQYPSHSGGGLAFGADGYLYLSGGDGAAWHFADYGQDGDPVNPCGDPPGGVGSAQTIPTAQGGRLRSQDLRAPGDPVGLNGSLIRIDPITGAAAPGNPLAGNSDANARRMLAYGLRNPFRLAVRPGTNDVFMADVGGGYWEEIDRVNAGVDPVKNFGWPCYEGGTRADGSVYAKKLASWDAMNLDMCEDLYADGTSAAPYWAYEHDVALTGTDNCDPGGNSISAIEFYPGSGGGFPTAFDGALFFADYSRECIWVMKKGANGLPDPTQIEMFGNLGMYPVDLKVGPNGDLFFVDIAFGQIRRISYTGSDNRAPTARIQASPTYGPAPLEVGFDASGSTDPDGDALTYAWDLDGDGEYDDSTEEFPRDTYAAGAHEVGLRVTDPQGAYHSDTVTINSGETPPSVSIDSPTAALNWRVGQTIDFSGSATDEQDGTLPASAFSWTLILNHCITVDACHSHPVQDFAGVSSGSFVAPDHGYPSHMLLEVTATDSNGLTDSKTVRLDPQTVNLTVDSEPANLSVTVDEKTAAAPLTHQAIVGATTTISAESPQLVGSDYYGFASWSDGKAQSHEITAPATDTTYTASFDQLTRMTFTPVADARVEEATPTTAYGTQNKLRIDGGADPDMQSYLRFNVSGVADGTVVAAKLRLSALTGSIDGPTLHSAANGWAESSVNWSTRPSTGTTVIDDRELINPNTDVEYNVKPLVGGDGTVSFGLLPASSDGLDFASREYADATKRPVLELLVATADNVPPTAPTGLSADALDARRVDLSWTPATDNRGVTNYEIYRDGSLLATTGNVTSFSDTTVSPQTTYEYEVKALDAAGNRSPASTSASATTPAAPLTTLTFTPVADARVEDGMPNSNFGTSTKLSATGGVPKKESYLRFQLAGVTGPVVSADLRMTSTLDGTKDGPALHGAGGGWNETELAWSNRPSHDASAADDVAAIPKGTVATYDATSLVNGNGTVNMALISTFNDNVDFGSREHGDESKRPQLIVTFDTDSGDTTPPSVPGTLTADAPTHTRVDLSWGAATDNVGVTGYEILRDGTPIATVGAVTSYADTTVSPLTHYDYAVKAIDAAGNRSTPSNTAGVNTPAPPATTTVTFDVVADARVEQEAASSNFGTSSKLRATNGPPTESYLRFALSGLTGTVQAAKLRVYASNDATNNGPAVHRADSSWTETGITWANRPARTAGPSDNKVAIAKESWVEYDVAPLVGGNGDITFVLVPDSTDGVNFASKEYFDPGKKAQLEVTFGN